jgi:RNA polymerase sigma-70 factor (ECF subfamily)
MINLSKIKTAPLYLVMSNLTAAGLSLRVFPLKRASLTRDGNDWTYPSTGSNKKVPVDSIGSIDGSNDKSYKVYATAKNKLEAIAKALLGQHQKVVENKFVNITAKTAVKPIISVASTVVSKTPAATAPVKLLVPKKDFFARDLKDINAVNDILSGKTNAFSVIYERYYEIVNRSFMLALKNNQDIADDLTMEFFTKIYEKIHQYKPDNTFNAWITRAAKNHLIDYTRKVKSEPGTVSIDRGPANNENGAMHNSAGDKIMLSIKDEDSLNGEEMIFNIEKKQALNKALLMLDKNSRQMLRLCYVENKTYQEIATEIGMNLSSVKVGLLRAKARLKNILETNKGLLAAVS